MLIPLGLSLPYLWRLMQCLRVYNDTGARPQLFNALKYSTAFPVIILSSLKYQVLFGPELCPTGQILAAELMQRRQDARS